MRNSKALVVALVSLVIIRGAALAQPASAEAPPLEGLRATEAPAFSILGLSPTEIQKPSTPKEVAVSLAQFLDKEGALQIPDDLAVQVAPYWLFVAKPKESDKEDYSAFGVRGAKQLLRNATLSLATAGVEGSDGRSLGGGVASHVGWGGRPASDCTEKDDQRKQDAWREGEVAYRAHLAQERSTLFDRRSQLEQMRSTALATDAEKATQQGDKSPRDAAIDDSLDDLGKRLEEIEAKMQVLDEDESNQERTRARLFAMGTAENKVNARVRAEKQPFVAAESARVNAASRAARQACAESLTAHPHSLALAAAWAWQFPDMTGGDGDLVTQAYWATYAWSSGRWSALGLARLRFEEAVVGWDGFVDGGGRVRYGGKGAAISIEALGRLQVRGEDKQDARSRLALVAELELKADNWLSLTLGKTFESEGPVALVSLTSSFGTPEVAPLSTK